MVHISPWRDTFFFSKFKREKVEDEEEEWDAEGHGLMRTSKQDKVFLLQTCVEVLGSQKQSNM